MTSIGSLNEKPLHRALKAWLMQPGDQTEVPVDPYVIDMVRDNLLIEVQTGHFAAMKSKLAHLTQRHPVKLVYPIAKEKWIVTLPPDPKTKPRRRKSPKRGSLLDVFYELVSIPELVLNPNFSLHVVLIHEEEVRKWDRRRGWRRHGWVTHERRLIKVLEEHLFAGPADFEAWIPNHLPAAFTTAHLADALNASRHFAQKMTYCLERMRLVTRVGKQGNAIVYCRQPSL